MKPNRGNGLEIQTELSRDLGLVSALAIGVGTMIAAGIFTLSGLAVGYVGSAAILAFLIAALVATFTALTYCEFSSVYPESGEGYLYARRTFAPPLAYLVGWCLLLGYASSCGFYIASFSSYFHEFIWHAPFEMLTGLIAVVLLTLLNVKGTKESGSFQVVITGGKILLLVWFVVGGLGAVEADQVVERFSTDWPKIGGTAAMVFITFFGFSAIAASAGEVRNPTKTIPRAIFIAMGLVTVLYILVVLVVLAANLSDYSEAAMGMAAKRFLGSVGGMVIVGGALFSMVSASNASILAGSRVALSMSQRGHLPAAIGRIHPRTRTPLVALVLVGIAIAAFALLLPLEHLAHFADCVLLVALILVNAALIRHRRKFPHLQRPFRVPWVPLLPVLGIVANVYLLTQIAHTGPLLMATGAIVVGLLGFLAWKGARLQDLEVPGKPSRVVLDRPSADVKGYRVLVPIANPANVLQLMDLAAGVAADRDGELVALRVAVVPDQVPPRMEEAYIQTEREILEGARTRAMRQHVPVSALVRIGHSAARAILETSQERNCNLIVLGWKGHTSTARHILGEITDQVANHVKTDILLAKLVGESLPKRLLLPTAGGEHAVRAEQYAASIAHSQGGSLTLLSVISPDAPEETVASEEERLRKAVERITAETALKAVDAKVVRDRSIVDGIAAEAEDYDGVIVGAAGKSFSSQILFGNIPEDVARRVKVSVFIVKRYDRVKALFGKVLSE